MELGDRDREAEEHRGFAIAPYGDGWEVTYEHFIRRVFPTKRKAIRWIDRCIDHGPAPRGIARQAAGQVDRLRTTERLAPLPRGYR